MTLLFEGLLIVALLLVPGIFGMLVVRRYLPSGFRHENRDHADPVWAIAGGAFGLLLGFMVVILWENLQQAQSTVQDEANDLVNLYQLTHGLPSSANPQQLREKVRAYTVSLVDDEWELLGKHQSSEGSEAALDDLWRSFLALEPSLGSSNVAYAEAVVHLSELQDARNRRINVATDSVPRPLWVVLIGGTVIVIAMTWFTGSDDFRTHLLTTVVLAISLAAILFLIRVFNNPFQGDVRARPEAIERALLLFEER